MAKAININIPKGPSRVVYSQIHNGRHGEFLQSLVTTFETADAPIRKKLNTLFPTIDSFLKGVNNE